jgi:hypothetical protein
MLILNLEVSFLVLLPQKCAPLFEKGGEIEAAMSFSFYYSSSVLQFVLFPLSSNVERLFSCPTGSCSPSPRSQIPPSNSHARVLRSCLLLFLGSQRPLNKEVCPWPLPPPESRPPGVGKCTGREKWRAGGREREKERSTELNTELASCCCC